MRKTTNRKKLTKVFVVFLALALVFLAVGLGTLGSTKTVGSAYELKTESNGTTPYVTFKLASTVKDTVLDENGNAVLDDKGKPTTKEYRYYCVGVYVNIANIYAEEGASATLRLEYSDSANKNYYTSNRYDGVLENYFTPEPEEGENAVSQTNALFRWANPFNITDGGWRTGGWQYVRISALGHSILINEIAFVAELRDGTTRTGRYALIPVTIESATPNNQESPEQAASRAQALIDAQEMPHTAQSSYRDFADEEVRILATLAELRQGRSYTTSVRSAYHIDKVYNTLGIDILALGTAIFGTSPFGLRFFPMLASFGVLLLGYFLVKQLTKSEKAGLIFAVLYILCNLSFALGHLGTPLMLGVFFFIASLFLCHKFYVGGMKKANLVGALPLIGSGICGAAAICVNGAFLIPVAAVVALFVCGMIRQQKAKRFYLDRAIAEAEAEPAPVAQEAGEEGQPELSAGKKKVIGVVTEYRVKNISAVAAFALPLILGTLLMSLLFMMPVYYTFVKAFDNPAAPTANIFVLAWHAFAGGFTGGASQSWNLFYTLFQGVGETYAVTAAVVNGIAALAAIAGLVFAVCRVAHIFFANRKLEKAERSELRRLLVPLAGLVAALVTSSFAGGALAFILLAYVFGFMLAAEGLIWLKACGGKAATAAKVCSIVGLILLVLVFAAFAVFTFSIPLPASFMAHFFG